MTGTQVASPSSYNPPKSAQQPGSSTPLQSSAPVAGGGRANLLTQAAFMNNLTYLALTMDHDYGNGVHDSVVMLWDVNPFQNFSLVHSAIFGRGSGYSYFMPGFYPRTNGNSVVGFAATGTGTGGGGPIHPSVAELGVTSGFSLESPPGYVYQSNSTYTESNAFNSSCSCYRWGDFFTAQADPLNTNAVWVTGMYSAGAFWATRIAEESA